MTLNIALLRRQPKFFTKIFLSMVQFVLFVLSLFWFAVSIRNRNLFLDVYFQDPRLKVLWRIHSRNSLQKFEGVTNCTRGVFFYLSPLLNILHFGLSLSCHDVGFQRRGVSTSQRLNVAMSVLPSSRTSRRWISTSRVGLDLLWNVSTLDPNVATSFLYSFGTSQRWFNHSLEHRDVGSQRRDVGCFPLWNVATLHSHVATLALFKAKNTLILLLPLFPSLPEPYCPCRRPHRRPCRNPLPPEAIVFPSDYLADFATTIHALPVHCPCLTPSTSRLGVLH